MVRLELNENEAPGFFPSLHILHVWYLCVVRSWCMDSKLCSLMQWIQKPRYLEPEWSCWSHTARGRVLSNVRMSVCSVLQTSAGQNQCPLAPKTFSERGNMLRLKRKRSRPYAVGKHCKSHNFILVESMVLNFFKKSDQSVASIMWDLIFNIWRKHKIYLYF